MKAELTRYGAALLSAEHIRAHAHTTCPACVSAESQLVMGLSVGQRVLEAAERA